jgi:hypothetical protein
MAVHRQDLIKEYRALHASDEYGRAGEHFRLHIQALIAELHPKIILNYGCGQSRIHEQLDLLGATFFRYDPAVEALSSLPTNRADFIINTDVLEHIPESDLDDILSDIQRISDKVFFNIATRLAKDVLLSNGQNPHCTIKPAAEWEIILKRQFPIVHKIFERPGHSCAFLTWDSCLVEVVASLEELPLVKESLRKSQESVFVKIIKELGRVRRRFAGRS